MSKVRVEKDSMGEVLVPSERLYGAQTQRAVQNFTIADKPMPWAFIEALLIIKQAAARANCSLGLLPEESATAIIEAVEGLRTTRPLAEFPVSVYQTGSGTSSNMNANEVIAGFCRQRGTILSPNDQVNLGQSSNDVIPSALRLSSSIQLAQVLKPALSHLISVIRNFAASHEDVIKTGRTHLMDALPIRLAAELSAWSGQLEDCLARINDCESRLRKLPLGGTAVGSGVNCHPDFPRLVRVELEKITGLQFTADAPFYKGLSNLDVALELSGQLRTLAVALSKIANDLRWMNSGPLAGLGEISLPSLQPGSSIMPAKVNPVIPEAVLMACAQVIGIDAMLSQAALGGNFQLNTMMPVAASGLLEAIDLLANAARSLADKAIARMQVNREVCQAALEKNPILVTALTPLIGYDQAAQIGKKAAAEGRTVFDVATTETELDPQELKRLLDPSLLADGG